MSSPSPAEQGGAIGAALRRRWSLLLLLFFIVLGVALERAGVFDWHAGVTLAQGYADRWWLAPALALLTAGLFALGLPGSLMVWVLGILFSPAIAAPAFVAGGVAGALGAHTLARSASRSGGREERAGRLLRLLARRSDFVTLVAVRVAPGFPHSAINLAAGILELPLGRFLVASALGLAIKGTLYADAIHRAVESKTLEEALTWRTLAPLGGLALVLLLAPWLVRRLRGRDTPES